MRNCWSADPASRPTFSQLVTDILNMVEELEHITGSQQRNIKTTYVNIDECTNYHYHDDLEQLRSNAALSEDFTNAWGGDSWIYHAFYLYFLLNFSKVLKDVYRSILFAHVYILGIKRVTFNRPFVSTASVTYHPCLHWHIQTIRLHPLYIHI